MGAPAVEMLGMDMGLAPDFLALLNSHRVPPNIIEILRSSGIVSMQVWALTADTQAEMRGVLRLPPYDLNPDAEGIDGVTAHMRRVLQATVLGAWVSAGRRVQERSAVEATQRASSLPLSLPAGDHVLLRRGFEAAFGRVEDKAFPSEALIERRLQEVELSAMTAESLTEVVSRAEATEDPMGITVDRDGNFKLKRGSSQVPLPADSEALRRRLDVLSASWLIARDRNPTVGWLASVSAEVWRGHTSYVLGEYVYGLVIPVGDTTVRPDWTQVLFYEHALRKEAVRQIMYSGRSFRDAMEDARKNMEVRQHAFLTPAMAQLIAKARAPRSLPVPSPGGGAAASSGGGGKGAHNVKKKNKAKPGKGKGKGKWHTSTKDGKAICFAYNSPSERCAGGCGRAHVCQACLGDHLVHQCGAGATAKPVL